MNERLPSWKATGMVEKAWKRIAPPRQKELARRLGLSVHTNLSKLNQGTMPMTHEYAARIVEAVRQDDPSFSLADLGAPSSAVADAEPTVLDRLEELAAALGVLTLRVDTGLEMLDERLRVLENAPAHRAVPTQSTSRRKRKAV